MTKEEREIIERFCHDIRTQLNSVSLGSQIFGQDASLNERQKTIAGRMLTSVERADAMIDTFRDSFDKFTTAG